MSVCSEVVKVGFYCIDRTVGKGNSSIVKHAIHAITKSEVAIKIIDKSLFERDSSLEKVKREIHALKTLRHPNIIKLYQVMESDKFIYLISEFVPNGEIFEHIAKHGKFPEKVAKLKFAQIVNAVDYCHQRGVVHRDLKAENLLLDAEFNVKLADFGFSNTYHSDQKLSTWCGSPPYAAPEIFEGQSYTGPEVDIWSLGVILYVLVCGMLPFDGENLRMVKERVVSGRFRIPFFMSTECERLLRKILVVDASKRYCMQQIKSHVWLSEAMEQVSSLEESFREQLVVTGRGVSLNCHDMILKRMEDAKIDKDKVLQSLQNHRYDNFSAIYELLLDRIARHIKQYPQSRLCAAGLRRPSVISEQVMLSRRVEGVEEEEEEEDANKTPCEAKAPTKLVETREAVFSQTTDGVLLHEVAGPLCQLQQRIRCHSDQSNVTKELSNPSGGTGVMIMPTSPIRPKLTRSPRLGVLSRGRKKMNMAETSIDEGVETEEEGVLPFFPLQPSRPPCHPSSSIDSNIEVDISVCNIFSPLEKFLSREEAHPPMPPSLLPTHDFSNFRKGRRASDGLVMKQDSSAAQNLFLKNRACGLAELRMELVKLQNRTVQQPHLPQLRHELQLLHPTQQQHLQQPPKEYKPLINNSYLINKIQKSLEEQQPFPTIAPPSTTCHRQFRNPPYNKVHSPLDHQPRPLSPLRGSFKRHLAPMRPLLSQLLHRCPSPSFYADFHLSSASTSPVRASFAPTFSPTTSLFKSPTPQAFYNANLSSYPPSVCQSGGNIPHNSALGSPRRKPPHLPTSILPLHISTKQHLLQHSDLQQNEQQQQKEPQIIDKPNEQLHNNELQHVEKQDEELKQQLQQQKLPDVHQQLPNQQQHHQNVPQQQQPVKTNQHDHPFLQQKDQQLALLLRQQQHLLNKDFGTQQQKQTSPEEMTISPENSPV